MHFFIFKFWWHIVRWKEFYKIQTSSPWRKKKRKEVREETHNNKVVVYKATIYQNPFPSQSIIVARVQYCTHYYIMKLIKAFATFVIFMTITSRLDVAAAASSSSSSSASASEEINPPQTRKVCASFVISLPWVCWYYYNRCPVPTVSLIFCFVLFCFVSCISIGICFLLPAQPTNCTKSTWTCATNETSRPRPPRRVLSPSS